MLIALPSRSTSARPRRQQASPTRAEPTTESVHLFVYDQGGKNTIKLKPYVSRNTTDYIQVPAFLYGEGSGGDHISAQGSAANNVLTGHGNNEVLTGGQGRDLLIDNYQHGQAVTDYLIGDVNANDWFFAGVNDVINAKNKNDMVTMFS
jgi:hypothetical protein